MLRVDSFKVKYRADGSVEQFVSGLSVLNEAGQLQQHQDISVNHPLHYQVRLCGQLHTSAAARLQLADPSTPVGLAHARRVTQQAEVSFCHGLHPCTAHNCHAPTTLWQLAVYHQRMIHVQHAALKPMLLSQGVTAYQADYGMAAVTVRVQGSPLFQPDQQFNLAMADLGLADGAAPWECCAWA